MKTTTLLIGILLAAGLGGSTARAHEPAVGVTTGLGTTPLSPLATRSVVSVQDFHQSLSPYGTWVQEPEYGLAWQPHAVVVDTGWQPYCHGGRWSWTEWGWTWQSAYEWGWAGFHYGRWTRSKRHRWVWIPDTTWGPAWVHWRWSQNHCGWAPLPPHAAYDARLGFHYRGRNVSFNFGVELTNHDYVFVSHDRFYSPNMGTVVLTGPGCTRAYRSSTCAKNAYVIQSGRVVHVGPSPILRTGGRRSHRVHRSVTGRPASRVVYTTPSRTVYVPSTTRYHRPTACTRPVYHPPVVTYSRPVYHPPVVTYSRPKPARVTTRKTTTYSTTYQTRSPRRSVTTRSYSPRPTTPVYVAHPQPQQVSRRTRAIRASVLSKLGR
jgi:hypothetical protein